MDQGTFLMWMSGVRLVGEVVLIALYGYAYIADRRPFLLAWTFAWVASSISVASQTWGVYAGSLAGNVPATLISTVAGAAVVLLLVGGAHDMAGRTMSRWWYAAATAEVLWTVGAAWVGASNVIAAGPQIAFSATGYLMTGALILRAPRGRSPVGVRVVAIAFGLWALYPLLYGAAFVLLDTAFTAALYAFHLLLILLAGFGMMLVYLGGVRAELETRVAARTAELALTNSELRDASAAKSRFVSSISHELRTPLNSILGFTGVMLAGLAGPVTEEQGRQLKMVRSSGEHLLRLIEDLLDLSRIEADRMTIGCDEVDPARVAVACIESIRPLAADKAIEVRLDVADGLPVMRTDEVRIRQVLINLLGNAVKFTERGEIALTVRAHDAGVRFDVRDTGVGIPEASLEHVFEEFEQLDSPDEGKSKGTGLGLAVSRGIAGLLGGTLTVASTVGEGSTFTLVLPVAAPDC